MKRLSILLVSTVLSLLAAEGALRILRPGPVGEILFRIDHLWGLDVSAGARALQRDSVLGYRPVLGGSLYDLHGARYNHYSLEKPTDKRRILFLGDSVTFRGRLIDAIAAEYGREEYEFWNAGVEGYSTLEEAINYRENVAEIEEDHVILVVHPNDALSTPISFPAEDGRVAIYRPGRGSWELDPQLVRACYLYALYEGMRFGKLDATPMEGARERCRTGLELLRQETTRRGARLTVLRFPLMSGPGDWLSMEREWHELGGDLCSELGLECVDLKPLFEAALAESPLVDIEAYRELDGDTWHPSDVAAQALARGLRRSGFEL